MLTRKRKFLTQFLTRLARISNLKITRLDPARQSMTQLARDLNIFRLNPSLCEGMTVISLKKVNAILRKISKLLFDILYFALKIQAWLPLKIILYKTNL